MKKLNMVVTVLSAASLVAACEPPTEPGIVAPPVASPAATQPQLKGIGTAAQAQIAFVLLRSSGQAVDRRIPSTFDGSTAVQGEGGWATVRGRKSSSSTSAETTAQSDLIIDFAGFALKSDAAVTGTMHWVDSMRLLRSSCTPSCTPARTEVLVGKGLKVRFVLNGETISDDVAIEAISPVNSPRWEVKVTTVAGQVFTFTVN